MLKIVPNFDGRTKYNIKLRSMSLAYVDRGAMREHVPHFLFVYSFYGMRIIPTYIYTVLFLFNCNYIKTK